jgi:hypothetical protein
VQKYRLSPRAIATGYEADDHSAGWHGGQRSRPSVLQRSRARSLSRSLRVAAAISAPQSSHFNTKR